MYKVLRDFALTFLVPAIIAGLVFMGFSVMEQVVGDEVINYPAIVAGWTFGMVFYRLWRPDSG